MDESLFGLAVVAFGKNPLTSKWVPHGMHTYGFFLL
jgi:hypothetical protein